MCKQQQIVAIEWQTGKVSFFQVKTLVQISLKMCLAIKGKFMQKLIAKST